ncbi:MAG: PBP1A family penicillin-binding protein [Sporolactobacillus sp.]
MRHSERLEHLRQKMIRLGIRLTIISCLVLLLGCAAFFIAAKLAGPLDIAPMRPALFYDDRGHVFGRFQQNNQQWLPITKVSPALKLATLAIEDKRFFHHHGFDVRRTISSALVDLRSFSKAQGASTITMQYARNLFLTSDKTWLRKAAEVFYTLRLEMNESKKTIFEGYLNTIYYGHGAYGIEAAAKTYFNKDADQLTLAEASMLAGIPNAPSLYSPFFHFNQAKARQKLVLSSMVSDGYITARQARSAACTPLRLAAPKKETHQKALYFQDALRCELVNKLHLTQRQLESGGLRIYTTLDSSRQQAAEFWIKKTIPARSALQTALVALDPRSGAVRALVGGRNYATSPFNRAVAARRAPGSAFKPFLYYAALRNGFTPATRLKSEPTAFAFDSGRGHYTPDNFGGYYADAPITMAQALALSDNIFAVKTHLAIGMNQLIEAARAAGITSPLAPIPSLALGVKPVSVLELARGYATLANDGTRIAPQFVTKIVDRSGHALYTWHPARKQVLNKQAAFVLSQMMTGIFNTRLNGYTKVTGAPVAGRLTHTIAAKTGSTATDSWMSGFTPTLVATVWVGYDKGETISTYPDSGYAKDIWSAFVESALDGQPKNSFKAPKGVVKVPVNPKTGRLAGAGEQGVPTYFIKGTQPERRDSGIPVKKKSVNQPNAVEHFLHLLFHLWK